MLECKQSLNQIYSALKQPIPPTLRFEIKQHARLASHFIAAHCFWKWQHSRFSLTSKLAQTAISSTSISNSTSISHSTSHANATTVHYFGRPSNKPVLMALLGLDGTNNTPINAHTNEVYVTEHPMRDAIRIPFYLITIVKLGRPIEDIVASYSKSLRRSINAERPNYRNQIVDDIQQVDAIERDMLKPYASARHDIGAAQLESGLVRKFSQHQHGRLDVLYHGDEAVGCHLGNPYRRKGKCYWHVNRLGYPQSVFSDYKRWGEVNSINLHLALEAAIANGYDYCDYGVSLAKPGHGLIEWKRRRRGFLATHDNFNFFYMRLPKTGGAQFLWDSPVFGVEDSKATLHLGIPEGKTDEELIERYHEMGYAGLYKVYLDCVKPPSAHFIDSIRALYADQESQPMIITYVVG